MPQRKAGAPISFRLPLEEERALATAAAETGTTVGEYARKLVRDGLQREFFLASIKTEMEELSRNLTNATLALLVNAGKCTAEQANAWLDRTWNRARKPR